MNVGPVPRGSTADRPLGLWQDTARSPHVHGRPLHLEAFGYLSDTYGVAVLHKRTVAKVLTDDHWCSDNQYMTKTETIKITAPCGCTFQGRVYSVRNCTVLDSETATGRQAMRHAMAAKKKAR